MWGFHFSKECGSDWWICPTCSSTCSTCCYLAGSYPTLPISCSNTCSAISSLQSESQALPYLIELVDNWNPARKALCALLDFSAQVERKPVNKAWMFMDDGKYIHKGQLETGTDTAHTYLQAYWVSGITAKVSHCFKKQLIHTLAMILKSFRGSRSCCPIYKCKGVWLLWWLVSSVSP